MFKTLIPVGNASQIVKRFYSSFQGLPKVHSIPGPFTTLNVETFRQNAFIPQTPLLIECPEEDIIHAGFPAIQKWFKRLGLVSRQDGAVGEEHVEMNLDYLQQFNDTILPYEYIIDKYASTIPPDLTQFIKYTDNKSTTFHHFHTPLQLFLSASSNPAIKQLYIAQAQFIDLPPLLRADLPTPSIVQQAGKSDIYDSNIWLGCPPTYTPLHKDPNPNLFVQLASQKVVRIFEPSVGRHVFTQVRRQLGESAREGMRGVEMMEGRERELLDEAVWGGEAIGGVEAVLSPMDALFIPKGWWHSIKSIGTGVNASANWWFR